MEREARRTSGRRRKSKVEVNKAFKYELER
jgi:hypothetical protein